MSIIDKPLQKMLDDLDIAKQILDIERTDNVTPEIKNILKRSEEVVAENGLSVREFNTKTNYKIGDLFVDIVSNEIQLFKIIDDGFREDTERPANSYQYFWCESMLTFTNSKGFGTTTYSFYCDVRSLFFNKFGTFDKTAYDDEAEVNTRIYVLTKNDDETYNVDWLRVNVDLRNSGKDSFLVTLTEDASTNVMLDDSFCHIEAYTEDQKELYRIEDWNEKRVGNQGRYWIAFRVKNWKYKAPDFLHISIVSIT